MDTCTTCGAEIRPGSRFCTTCGTRVNAKSADDNGWGAASRSVNTDDQQTSVLTPVSAAETNEFSTTERSRGWGDAWGASQPAAESSDPASRFISALDSDVKPVESTEIESGWGTPTSSDTAFASWNHDDQQTVDDSWKAPSTWGTPQPSDETSVSEEVEAVAEPVVVETEVSEEPEETAIAETTDQVVEDEITTPVVEIAEDDPRHRVLELLGELQELVPQIAVISTDEGTAAMTLTEVSLRASNFTDLADVVNVVKDNPRDIQALGELAGKINRIEALLQEHGALTDAIESALEDLGSK